MISIASFLTVIRLWPTGQFNKAGKRNELSLFPSPIATRCRCRFTSKSEVAEWEQSLCGKPEIRTKKKITNVFLMFLSAPLLQSRQGKTFEHESYFPGMNLLVTTPPKDCKKISVWLLSDISAPTLTSAFPWSQDLSISFLPYSLQAATTPCILVNSGQPLWPRRWSPELW